MVIVRICVLNIIIKSAVWPACYSLGLVNETMVCAVSRFYKFISLLSLLLLLLFITITVMMMMMMMMIFSLNYILHAYFWNNVDILW